jgi:hypothetical protein
MGMNPSPPLAPRGVGIAIGLVDVGEVKVERDLMANQQLLNVRKERLTWSARFNVKELKSEAGDFLNWEQIRECRG